MRRHYGNRSPEEVRLVHRRGRQWAVDLAGLSGTLTCDANTQLRFKALGARGDAPDRGGIVSG